MSFTDHNLQPSAVMEGATRSAASVTSAKSTARRTLLATAFARHVPVRKKDVVCTEHDGRMMFIQQTQLREVSNMSVADHFSVVASVYDALRTTDEAPVRRIRELLPDRRVIGLDIGCGTGRYSRLLRGVLHPGSVLVASDVSAAMLAELKTSDHGQEPVLALRSTAEQVPVRTGSLDLVTAFNSVHHFDLEQFLAVASRVLKPNGQLFIYTRTPEQNARTIWGRYFPGFAEREQRLHSEAALREAVRRTPGLKLVDTQTFRHPRSSTPERLRAQVEGHHYSTFSLYSPDELRVAIATFLGRLAGPEVTWIDEHLLVVAGRSWRDRRRRSKIAATTAAVPDPAKEPISTSPG
jgi:ubiquinone/menaquinone biosynthesis C-methylase UbiE